MYFCSKNIMPGPNLQECHRVNILRIGRHCSCMPSCRRDFISYFNIQNTFEYNENILLLTNLEYTLSTGLCGSVWDFKQD